MEKESNITCPNCGESINVNELLYTQLEDQIRKGFNQKLADQREKYNRREAELKAGQEALQQQEAAFQEKLNTQVKEKLKANLDEQKSALEKKLKEEHAAQFEEIQKELKSKSEQLQELGKSKAEVERLKREKAELKTELEAEAEKALNERLKQESDRIRQQVKEQNELKFKEYEKQLEDQKVLMDEMQRKHEQGSMQMQGEVQELAIEEYLGTAFPLDTIEEIKKGVRGADCMQIVNTYAAQNCGKIYYESKRAKDFQPTWIEKFKQDMRDRGADLGVLVSEAMPSDMDRMGLKDGVWICTFEEFKALSNILRESLIKLSEAVGANENRGDKMTMLYGYLTSNEFRMQIEAIVEGFTQMRSDLDSEKRAMQRIWKSREKQIEKVITNTVDMYSSVKGIAGNAVGTVQALELPGTDEEDNSNA